MRSLAFASVVLAVCGCGARPAPIAAKVPLPAPAPPPPAQVAPPAKPTFAAGSVRPRRPPANGCTLRSHRYRTVALSATPGEKPFVTTELHDASFVFGEDGAVGADVTLWSGAFLLRGFVVPRTIELYTKVAGPTFGGILETRGAVRWGHTDASGKVTVVLALPDDVTFDGQGTVSADVACEGLSLDPLPRRVEGPMPVYSSGPLSRSADGPPMLVGFSGEARIINSDPTKKWVRLMVRRGDLTAFGWAPRKNVSEAGGGIGHGYGIGFGGTMGYRGSPDSVACSVSFVVYKQMADRSIAEVGRFAGGAPFLRGPTTGEWVSVRLGPEGDPVHDAGWIVHADDIASCKASGIRSLKDWKL